MAEMTKELSDRKLAHDFANEGDCPYCGDIAHLIGTTMPDGRVLRPCFEWERVQAPDPEEK